MDRSFLQARITAAEAQVVLYENAIAALLTDGVQSYKLDTGQTVQWVTKADIASLQVKLNLAENRLAALCNRLNGGSVVARPGW